ncbi:MAG: Hpt domain-containing protein [Alphaproteobacteria bacterium]|jgi:chemotaxis protein histidine kinase CheA|nr:Hpt domain-containing protein [Alphaproteobacteria bacterium]
MSLATDHQVITRENRLLAKARPSRLSFTQMMAKAHQAMASIAEDYLDWLEADLKALQAALRQLRDDGGDDRRALTEMFRISHDVRGQGATFDYALASQISSSLCDFVERRSTAHGLELLVIEAHIDALHAFLLYPVSGDGGAIGRDIMSGLSQLIEKANGPSMDLAKRD